MPQLYHFIAEQFKENLMLGGQSSSSSQQHMVAGRLCQYLKPWQLEGLRFLYKNHEKGEACILNDESGLGKVVTVTTFLGSILTNDTTKKCLIVVRDESAIEEWRFHLSVLTHLTNKVIEKTSDINFDTVFLIIKWSTLKNIEIDKINFDHIIVDNRGEMLNNKFCTGILLRYFENKTTIIISSVDVTSDIKLLHILLRLCGRLDRQYTDVKIFEDKFQLPQLQEGVSNKVDLEDYFVKRERVINFCREFRLRRYCHQFDEEFPIVSRSEFQRHLQQWQSQNKNSLSSGSVKQERDICRLDYEVQQYNEQLPSVMDYEDTANSSDDVVVMSPLLLVSESESDDDQTQIQNNDRNSQFIEEIDSEEKKTRNDDEKKTSKRDSENTSVTNRRKSKKPTKTLSKSNNTMHQDDSKNLRSRALTSPKKPLPLRTKSRKSLETERVKVDGNEKQNKDKETEKRLKNQEKVKTVSQKEEEKTKQNKEVSNTKIKETQENPKQDKEEKNKDKVKNSKGDESLKKNENSPKEKKPEESSKAQKESRTESTTNSDKSEKIQETQTPTRTPKVKLRSFRQSRYDKLEKPKNLTEEFKKHEKKVLNQLENCTSVIDSHNKTTPIKEKSNEKVKETKNDKDNKPGEIKKIIIPKNLKSNIAIMLEEAQKFVRNENIGRRVKKSENVKSRANKLEVPEVIVVTKKAEESPKKSVSPSNAPKCPQSPKEKNLQTTQSTQQPSKESSKQTAQKSPKSPNETNKQFTQKVQHSPKETKRETAQKSPQSPKETNKQTPQKAQKSPKEETTKQTTNNIKNKSANSKSKCLPVTELTPIGVHSISTRGMQRHTRSNPVTSKYMKVAIAQVSTAKKTTPKRLVRRRRSIVVVRKVPPKEKHTKPPSPTPSVLSPSPAESMQLGQALEPTNNFLVPEVITPAPRNFNYHFPLMLDRETSDSECQIASQISNNQEVIVLTGSSTNDHEMEPPKSTVSRRKTTAVKPPMVTIHRPMFSKAKSPDLFSTCSDLSLPCSQQQTNKTQFEGFKIFGSELRQPPVKQQRSCLDILERMLEPRSGIVAGKKTTPTPTPTQEKPKTPSHQHCMEDEDAMFEITANGTFGNTLRVNSNGEMSPIRNKSQSTPPASAHPKNRITNYLISNSQHLSSLAQPSFSSLEEVTDLLPKTPKRRKSLSGNVKRSPRPLSTGMTGGGKSQSTKLTQWLVKNSNAQVKESPGKPQSSKRRRLDLSFPDK
ncbi:protein suppressor of underreplication isoform X2 [Episyrphus balteatus]|uniref:protein suppressor of underreplication isoform X2 n=1 Tax=Episyrphus balteatus TaxID=286459 RepID=UPI002485D519|nr:protein suppressor of underreplication isoform X2 [Episyrphus balteatus]